MSTQKFCNELNSLDCPEIETPVYQSCLKQMIEAQEKGKRDQVVTSLEETARFIFSNRFIVSGFGVTFTLVILFVITLHPSNQNAQSKVQASDVIEEMEFASSKLQPEEILEMEEKLQMSFEEMMTEMKTARSRMVYEFDPRLPMRVVDAREASVESHVVFFTQDAVSGELRGQVMHMNSIPAESSHSAFGTRRIFQYSREEGNIVMLEISEDNLPQSSIVLASN